MQSIPGCNLLYVATEVKVVQFDVLWGACDTVRWYHPL